jgi:site-specific DNA recombinase
VTAKLNGLRIVTDTLWDTAHASIATRRKGVGGRPTRGTDSKYLLTGFVRCGVCGGAMVQGWQGFPGYPVYRCWYNQSRGRTVCTNTLTAPMLLADQAILRAVDNDVLDPDVVEAALDLALATLSKPDPASATPRDTLSAELQRIDTARN